MIFKRKDQRPNLNDENSLLSEKAVVTRRSWMILSFAGMICLAAVLWAFFGSIPLTIEGLGIFLGDEGLASIQAKAEGNIDSLQVKAGQKVRKGELLLKITNPQLELKYAAAEKSVEAAEKALEELKQAVEKEKLATTKSLQSKVSGIEFSIAQLKEQVAFGTEELSQHRVLFEKGLISGEVYRNEEQQLIQKQIALQDKFSSWNDYTAELKKEYRSEEVRTKEQQLLNVKAQRDLLRVSLNETSVYSPYDGEVLEVLVETGDRVVSGKSLVWMEKRTLGTETNLKFYAYLPVSMGKRITMETPIQINVPQINKNEYGSIIGKVGSMSQYAVSKDNIYKRIQNQTIANTLIGPESADIEITIDLLKDPNNPTKLLWTSGKQPDIDVSVGTIGEVIATVEQVRPIYYLIPLNVFKITK